MLVANATPTFSNSGASHGGRVALDPDADDSYYSARVAHPGAGQLAVKSTRFVERVPLLPPDDRVSPEELCARQGWRAQRSAPLNFRSEIDVFRPEAIGIEVLTETHEKIELALHQFDQPMMQALRNAVAHVPAMAVAAVSFKMNDTIHSASAIEAQLLSAPLDIDESRFLDDSGDGADFVADYEMRTRGRVRPSDDGRTSAPRQRDQRFVSRFSERRTRPGRDAPMSAHLFAEASGLDAFRTEGDGVRVLDDSVFAHCRRFPQHYFRSDQLVHLDTYMSATTGPPGHDPGPRADGGGTKLEDDATERHSVASTVPPHLAALDDESSDAAALAEWRERRARARPAIYRRPHEPPARLALLRPPEALIPTQSHPRSESMGGAAAGAAGPPSLVAFVTAAKRSAATHDRYARAACGVAFSTVHQWFRVPPPPGTRTDEEDLVEPETHAFLVDERGRREDGVRRAARFDARRIAARCPRNVFETVPSVDAPDMEDLVVVAPQRCDECGRCTLADETGTLVYRPRENGTVFWLMIHSTGPRSAANLFLTAFLDTVEQTAASWATRSGERVDLPYVRDQADPTTLNEFVHLGGPLQWEATHARLRQAWTRCIEPDDQWLRVAGDRKGMYSQSTDAVQ